MPGKPGSTKPVIARFYCSHLCTLCFRRKRDFATKTARKPAETGATARSITGEPMVGSEEGGDMPTPSTKISPGWPS